MLLMTSLDFGEQVLVLMAGQLTAADLCLDHQLHQRNDQRLYSRDTAVSANYLLLPILKPSRRRSSAVGTVGVHLELCPTANSSVPYSHPWILQLICLSRSLPLRSFVRAELGKIALDALNARAVAITFYLPHTTGIAGLGFASLPLGADNGIHLAASWVVSETDLHDPMAGQG
jgi:hypothetical protein